MALYRVMVLMCR